MYSQVYQRLSFEWQLKPLFSLIEPENESIDVKSSFISTFARVIPIRIALFLWCLTSIVIGAFSDQEIYFFLAYLTNWTSIVSLSYLLVSIATCFDSDNITQHSQGTNIDKPSNGVMTMWILYSIAAPASITITFLFWFLDYDYEKDGPVTYCHVFEHGIFALLLLLDGNIIAKVPLRLKHGMFFMFYCLTYAIWTMIFAYSGLEKTPMYDVLDWINEPKASAFTTVFIIFLFSPIIFLLCWVLSLHNRRRVKIDTLNNTEGFLKISDPRLLL